jgi:zinc protease
MKECVEELRKQIDLMDSDDYLTDAQLANAKRILEIKKIREEDITTDYVHSLTFWWASASMEYYFNYEHNLNNVTLDNVKAYLRKYIKNKPFSAGLLINPEQKAQLNPDDFFKTADLSH